MNLTPVSSDSLEEHPIPAAAAQPVEPPTPELESSPEPFFAQ